MADLTEDGIGNVVEYATTMPSPLSGILIQTVFGVASRVASRARSRSASRRAFDRRVAERTADAYLPVEHNLLYVRTFYPVVIYR